MSAAAGTSFRKDGSCVTICAARFLHAALIVCLSDATLNVKVPTLIITPPPTPCHLSFSLSFLLFFFFLWLPPSFPFSLTHSLTVFLSLSSTPPIHPLPLLFLFSLPSSHMLTQSLVPLPSPPLPPLFLYLSAPPSHFCLSPSLHSSPAHSSFSFSLYLPPSLFSHSHTHTHIHTFKYTPSLIPFLSHKHTVCVCLTTLKAVIINDVVIRASRSTSLNQHMHTHSHTPLHTIALPFFLFSLSIVSEKEAALAGMNGTK